MTRVLERRLQKQQADRQGYFILAGMAVALGAIGTASVLLREGERDTTTGCLKSGRSPHQELVVVDQTEAWPEAERGVLRDGFLSMASQIKPEERLTIFGFDGRDEVQPKALFDRCRPREGKDVNVLIATPALADRSFQQSFEQPLQKTLSLVTTPTDAKETRLVGFLSTVVGSALYRNQAEQTTLQIWSDLGEHTTSEGSLISSKRKLFDPASFTAYAKSKNAERLKGVLVEVHVVPTPSSKPATKRIKDAWTAMFSSLGIRFNWRVL